MSRYYEDVTDATMLEVKLTNTEAVRGIYLDLDLIFLLFLLSLRIRFFLHLALMLLDSLATSTMASTSPSPSAYTRASARVRRPSASVLSTSMVFWLDAVRISPGRMASALTMFSHDAMMKCVSTPSGLSSASTRAAPCENMVSAE